VVPEITFGLLAARAMSMAPILERFWSKLDAQLPLVGCWEWRGARNTNGYGVFRVDGRLVLAHRFCYEQLVGPIDAGRELDHRCRNRACVRPDHLEPVDHATNVRRGVLARRAEAVV
jgi:hypothetical protein